MQNPDWWTLVPKVCERSQENSKAHDLKDRRLAWLRVFCRLCWWQYGDGHDNKNDSDFQATLPPVGDVMEVIVGWCPTASGGHAKEPPWTEDALAASYPFEDIGVMSKESVDAVEKLSTTFSGSKKSSIQQINILHEQNLIT